MDESTARRLVAINRTFYQRFYAAFDETRTRAWPGWRRVLDTVCQPSPQKWEVLDLGCGNGRWAGFLLEQALAPLSYEGWDDCRPLLARAEARFIEQPDVRFRRVDLLAPPWPEAAVDLVGAFGLLHHVPSFERRRETLCAALACLRPGGYLAICFWQFAPRGQPRVATAPWSAIGMDADRLDPGDHLVRWRRGGDGLRYCHHTEPDEVDRLVESLPAIEVDRFASDGADRDLNLYVVLTPAT